MPFARRDLGCSLEQGQTLPLGHNRLVTHAYLGARSCSALQ